MDKIKDEMAASMVSLRQTGLQHRFGKIVDAITKEDTNTITDEQLTEYKNVLKNCRSVALKCAVLMHPRALIRRVETYCRLPRAVVEVRVPRGPGAVEGKGQLLVVLVLLTPHPKSLEHLVCTPQKRTDVRPRVASNSCAMRAPLCWWRTPAEKHINMGSSQLASWL